MKTTPTSQDRRTLCWRMSGVPSRRNPAHAHLARATARGLRATMSGILVSAVLAGVKILSGVAGNSYALIADGVESTLDVFSSLVVFGALKISSAPPNEKYPFGYGRVEPLGAVVVSVALLVAAGGIAIQSVREIVTPHHPPAPFTLAVLLGVVATKELMYRRLLREGEAIGSRAVQSDAWHARADALTSLAAFVGISVALVGGHGFESADDWGALSACLVIGFNGIRLFRAAMADVLDAAPPEEIEHRIRVTAGAVPDVKGIDKCRVRRSGLGLFVDIHVMVDGATTVRHGHDIGHAVQDALLTSPLGVVDAVIHIEPDPDLRRVRETN